MTSDVGRVDAKPWPKLAAWSAVAFCYLIAFVQRVAPLSAAEQLGTDFHASAFEIGLVFAAYFYAYMLMQLPAGMINDVWPVRSTVLMSTAISAVATLAFSAAETWWAAAIARTFVAVGDVFVFTALMKLTAELFPPNRFAFMAGLGQLAGFLGGVIAAVPFTIAVQWWGWRSCFAALCGFSLAGLLACLAFVPRVERPSSPQPMSASINNLLSLSRSSLQWVAIATASSGYVVFLTLSGTWGFLIFVQGYGYSTERASLLVGAFVGGSAAGTLLAGYVVDRYRASLRGPFILTAALRLALLLLLVPQIGEWLGYGAALFCMALLGFIGGAQNPAIVAVVRHTQGFARLAVAIALLSTVQNLAGACLQPLFGAILDAGSIAQVANGVQMHSPESIGWLLAVLALGSTAAGLCVLFATDREFAAHGA